MSEISSDLARIFRAESGIVLASLLVNTRDFDLAEDALQDALLQASEQWSVKGVPDNKGAWLLTTARRRMIDRIRKESHRSNDQTIQNILDTLPDNKTQDSQPIQDERLKLIFTCCHPALSQDARIALTLKTLCGLNSKEIARAFLTSEITMNQRLTRTKKKIRDAGISYKVPENEMLDERLHSVLSVLYLIFNESYSAYESQTLTRKDLAEEAIHLARVLYQLLPKPEVGGLLSLLLLHYSRFEARSNSTSSFIPLEEQDRSLWRQDLIKEGTSILLCNMAQGKPGPYQIQASISALHAEAPSWEKTDWPQIIELYHILYRHAPSPIIHLNRIIAISHLGSYDEAYREIKRLEKALSSYQPYYAAKADIAVKLNHVQDAIESYGKAIKMSRNGAERDFLIQQRSNLME